MKTFGRVERQSLSEKVAAETEKAITSGAYPVGSRLPSEQTLTTQFGVSRNVVREGLRLLQERGLLETRNGSGAYVLPPATQTATNALSRYMRLTEKPNQVRALYEARRVLEGANVTFAAERANEADIAEMSAALERMRDFDGSVESWSEADLAFHLAISRAAHSVFLGMLLEPLVGQLRNVIEEGFQIPGAMKAGFEEHERILESIRHHRPDEARENMHYHLHQSESHVQKDSDAS